MGALWQTSLWKLSLFIQQLMMAQTQGMHLEEMSQRLAEWDEGWAST